MADSIERLKAEQQRLIAAEAAAAKHARQLAAELDAVTHKLIALDAATAAAHAADVAHQIINAGRARRNEPPLDNYGNVVPFKKD
jgi:hypothetical protein